MIIEKEYSGIRVRYDVSLESDTSVEMTIYHIMVDAGEKQYHYVGKTTQPLQKRIWGHCYDAVVRKGKDKKSNVFRKYKNITVSILLTCVDEHELDERERFYVSECYEKHGRLCMNTDLIDKRTYSKKYYFEDDEANPYINKVHQYALDGTYLASYPSVREAARVTGVCRNTITRAIQAWSFNGGGYQWISGRKVERMAELPPIAQQIKTTKSLRINVNGKFPETPEEKKKREQKARGRKVNQYDLDGNLIKTYPSLSEAASQLDVDKKGVWMACKGKYEQAYGFQFRYKGDEVENPPKKGLIPHNQQTSKWNVKSKGKKVRQYTLSGEFVQEYPSINQVELKYKIRGLKSNIDKGTERIGFIWKLVNEEDK